MKRVERGTGGVGDALWRRCSGLALGLVTLLCVLLCCSADSVSRDLLQSLTTVTFDGKSGKSLDETLADIKRGQTLVLDLPRVELAATLNVSRSGVTLRGASGRTRTQLVCPPGQSALVIRGNATLENLVITGCQTASAVQIPTNPKSEVNVTLKRLEFRRNSAVGEPDFLDPNSRNGGAIRAGAGTTVNILDGLFRNNSAIQGGAIFTEGSLTVQSSIFVGNEADTAGGGAICAVGSVVLLETGAVAGPTNVLSVQNCQFEENLANNGGIGAAPQRSSGSGAPIEANEFFSFEFPSFSGGALLIRDVQTLQVKNSSFSRNKGAAGGAMFIYVSETLTPSQTPMSYEIDKSNFTANKADPQLGPEDGSGVVSLGGAIFASVFGSATNPSFQDSFFMSNEANYGGALHLFTTDDNTVEIQECRFEGNRAATAGGAVLARNVETIRWNATTVKGNSAELGGGMLMTNAASLNIEGVTFNVNPIDGTVSSTFGKRSVFEGNIALEGGGFMCFGCNSVVIKAANFSGNHATQNGGAVSIVDSTPSGTVELNDVIVEDNLAQRGGGVYMDSASGLNLRAFTEKVQPNLFQRNKAVSGGGLYLVGKNLQKNSVQITRTALTKNEAVPFSLLRKSLSGDQQVISDSRKQLLKEKGAMSSGVEGLVIESVEDCGEGGGGGLCVVVNQVPKRALARVILLDSVIEANSALNGGGMFIAIGDEGWGAEPCNGVASLSSDPCRSFWLINMNFTENFAKYGGGAIFVTDPKIIFSKCSVLPGDSESFITVKDVVTELNNRNQRKLSQKKNNTSGIQSVACLGFDRNEADGFGELVATKAVSLEILEPQDKKLLTNHTSGQPLAEGTGVQIRILDSFGQWVNGGNSDAEIMVTAESTSVTGESIARAKNGVANFTGLIGFDMSGNHSITFTTREVVLQDVNVTFEIRKCLVGEEKESNGKGCKLCSREFYTFEPEVVCLQCPHRANCTGGATLVPKDGFWHSTPYSPHFHPCIVSDACIFPHREERLMEFYSNLSALTPSADPISNDEYQQCAEGYTGVLCGSCLKEYGHFPGGECKECRGSSATIGLIMVFAFWSLLLVAFEVFNSVSTNRELVRAGTFDIEISAQQALELGWASKGKAVPALTNDGDVPVKPAPTSSAKSKQLTADRVRSTRYIDTLGSDSAQNIEDEDMKLPKHTVAAENLTETVKIFTNFLQVTSVAISIGVRWDVVVDRLLAVQEVIAGISNGATLVPLDCILPNDSETPKSIMALWLRVTFPVALLFTFWVLITVLWMIKRTRQIYKNVPHDQRANLNGLLTYIIIVTITVVFFAYNSVTEEFMRTVNCTEVDEISSENEQPFSKFAAATTGKVWAEDTALMCFEGDHTATGLVGVFGMALFSMGFILFIVFWLGFNREQLNEPNFVTRYGFLYRAYRKQCHVPFQFTVYWEAIVTLRKALITAAVVFAYPLGGNLQCVMALGVLILALVMHLLFRPYRNFPCFNTRVDRQTIHDRIDLNHLESFSIFVSTVTFYSGIVYDDENTSDGGRLAMTIFVVMMNILLIVYMGFRIHEGLHVLVDAKLEDMSVANNSNSLLVRKCLKLSNGFVMAWRSCKT